MSVLKFTHYQVRAHEKGVVLVRVKGLVGTYSVKTTSGMRLYFFTDADMIQYVNSL